MGSLYAQYISERASKHIIENEFGFLVYSIEGQVLYIEDVYVKPEQRRTHLAKQMAEQAIEHAKQMGCKKLLGSVSAIANEKHQSVVTLINYGMKFHTVNGSMVYFIKDI